MTDECPDFDETLRTMLNTPPQVHRRLSDQKPDDGDDQVEAGEDVTDVDAG